MNIEKVVRASLGSENIARVEHEVGQNRDGQPVVRIRIVIADGAGEIPGQGYLDLSDALRSYASDEGSPTFPVVKYISESEYSSVVAAE